MINFFINSELFWLSFWPCSSFYYNLASYFSDLLNMLIYLETKYYNDGIWIKHGLSFPSIFNNFHVVDPKMKTGGFLEALINYILKFFESSLFTPFLENLNPKFNISTTTIQLPNLADWVFFIIFHTLPLCFVIFSSHLFSFFLYINQRCIGWGQYF